MSISHNDSVYDSLLGPGLASLSEGHVGLLGRGGTGDIDILVSSLSLDDFFSFLIP